jgi:Cu/Ag efflux protein CusF
MRRTIVLIAAGTLAGWVATAGAQDVPDSTGSAQPSSAQRPPTAMAAQMVTTSAKVKKIDVAKRELTLASQDGRPFTLNVPESVTRLDNIKIGDSINVTFYESVAVSLKPEGTVRPGVQKEMVAERTPGALPGGATAERITETAKITKIDTSQDELTIETSAGKVNTIKVEDPQMKAALDKLKVGDKVKTTYTQAMATSVTPAHHM